MRIPEPERTSMSEPATVAVLVGSLRAASYSRRIAKALIARAPASLRCSIVEIGDLPLYNEDLDANAARALDRLPRRGPGRAEAVLFVTPEYNRSVPGGLKNAVDVGSRPLRRERLGGPRGRVVSVTPATSSAPSGPTTTCARRCVFLDMPAMQQPEAYIGGVADLLAEDGSVKDAGTDTFLKTYMEKFGAWVGKVRE